MRKQTRRRDLYGFPYYN